MEVKRVGVVGAGIMGAGVAEVAAKAGFEVVVRSRAQATADALLAGVEKSLTKQVDKGALDDAERTATLSRLQVVTDLGELATCDLVLESVVEDLATKRHLFTELDRVCDDGAILATNTSTLPVVELAMATGRPERVCGIHFFNPAPVMSLVEVVRAITSSDETIAAARSFAEQCGKTVVDVRDQAGFIVNALLFPYLNNAVKLLDAGVASRDDIDAAMQGGCNFPMGPLSLLDLVGLDTSLAILEALYAEFKDPNYAPAPLLRRLVSAERYGRKSGEGFYEYRKR
ncbi:MAG TPA: 3-hydroxybutyryl-CoA dehydrogenase [Acidimicrobiia bacterium]|nr:3-hydroxybutyryl-CoA dehydrogenase [Acidimicrobiia bacterium]